MDVALIIGTGGMGRAIAHRIGSGKQLLLADYDVDALEQFAASLRDDGHAVTTRHVDISSRASVVELADAAKSLGPVRHLVNTAGVSPVGSRVETILRIDLVGLALVTEVMGSVMADGGAGVVIASMAGHMLPLEAAVETELARLPGDDLYDFAVSQGIANEQHAYAFAKRANHLRVASDSKRWGLRGARLNSISPGIIATSMGRGELEGHNGEQMRQLIEASATQRLGTANDIAAATAFLLSADASFITGTDLLVDGGVMAAMRTGLVGVDL